MAARLLVAVHEHGVNLIAVTGYQLGAPATVTLHEVSWPCRSSCSSARIIRNVEPGYTSQRPSEWVRAWLASWQGSSRIYCRRHCAWLRAPRHGRPGATPPSASPCSSHTPATAAVHVRAR